MIDFDDFKNFIKVIFIVMFSMVCITVFVYLLTYPLNKKVCERKYENSYYGFYEGCMIDYNGKYIPDELYIKAFEQNLIIKNNEENKN